MTEALWIAFLSIPFLYLALFAWIASGYRNKVAEAFGHKKPETIITGSEAKKREVFAYIKGTVIGGVIVGAVVAATLT